jgi:DNA-binding LacI/PurR family transcriptional regulator
MVTRNDVARLAGVSPATVSYVLNNGPRPVAVDTREKVLQVIRELNYHPSAVARNLRMQRTSTLGLILPDTQNPFYSEVTRGIESFAFEKDYTVILCPSGYSLERELQYIDTLYMQRVAGVIIIPATASMEPYDKLNNSGVPTVVVDRYVEGHKVIAVTVDNFRGGYLATEHLIKLGHRRIGAIVRPIELSHSQKRVQGYIAALNDYQIPIDERLIAPGGYEMENGRRAFKQLIQADPPPTAIFAYNDIMAIGALRGAIQYGLSVPRDFSIVGFDDIPFADFTNPSLTTVSQAKFNMGRRGAELLLRMINGETISTEAEPLLDVKLVVRESSGLAPKFALN